MSLSNFPFATVATPGDRAEQLLLRMRVELQPRSQVPVIVGDTESASRLVEAWNYGEFSFDDALRAATATQPKEWFQERIDEDPEVFGSLLEAQVYPKSTAPMTRLQVGFDHSGKPRKEVFIAQLPTPDYWAIPLHLRFGAWNACPEPSAHAMLAGHWGQRYGARMAALTSDTIEFTVEPPPASPEECTRLAREQYIYCADIVDQGVGSVPTLAKALRGSNRWFFWWD
jgi:hypothetical protein